MSEGMHPSLEELFGQPDPSELQRDVRKNPPARTLEYALPPLNTRHSDILDPKELVRKEAAREAAQEIADYPTEEMRSQKKAIQSLIDRNDTKSEKVRRFLEDRGIEGENEQLQAWGTGTQALQRLRKKRAPFDETEMAWVTNQLEKEFHETGFSKAQFTQILKEGGLPDLLQSFPDRVDTDLRETLLRQALEQHALQDPEQRALRNVLKSMPFLETISNDLFLEIWDKAKDENLERNLLDYVKNVEGADATLAHVLLDANHLQTLAQNLGKFRAIPETVAKALEQAGYVDEVDRHHDRIVADAPSTPPVIPKKGFFSRLFGKT